MEIKYKGVPLTIEFDGEDIATINAGGVDIFNILSSEVRRDIHKLCDIEATQLKNEAKINQQS
jgi:hypothetical protein